MSIIRITIEGDAKDYVKAMWMILQQPVQNHKAAVMACALVFGTHIAKPYYQVFHRRILLLFCFLSEQKTEQSHSAFN